jgi:hypothetical protein
MQKDKLRPARFSVLHSGIINTQFFQDGAFVLDSDF